MSLIHSNTPASTYPHLTTRFYQLIHAQSHIRIILGVRLRLALVLSCRGDALIHPSSTPLTKLITVQNVDKVQYILIVPHEQDAGTSEQCCGSGFGCRSGRIASFCRIWIGIGIQGMPIRIRPIRICYQFQANDKLINCIIQSFFCLLRYFLKVHFHNFQR